MLVALVLVALVLCAIMFMKKAKQQKNNKKEGAAAAATAMTRTQGGYDNPLFVAGIPVRSAAEIGITGYTDVAPRPPSAGENAGAYMDVNTGGLIREGLDVVSPRAISAAGGGAMAVGVPSMQYIDMAPDLEPDAGTDHGDDHGDGTDVTVAGSSARTLSVGVAVSEASIDVHPAANGEPALYDQAGPGIVAEPALYDQAGAGNLEVELVTTAAFTAVGTANAVDAGAYFADVGPENASDGAYKMVTPYDAQIHDATHDVGVAIAQLGGPCSAAEAYFAEDVDLTVVKDSSNVNQYKTVIPYDQQVPAGVPPPAPPPASVDDDCDVDVDDALPELPPDLSVVLPLHHCPGTVVDALYTNAAAVLGDGVEVDLSSLAGKLEHASATFTLQHDDPDSDIDL